MYFTLFDYFLLGITFFLLFYKFDIKQQFINKINKLFYINYSNTNQEYEEYEKTE